MAFESCFLLRLGNLDVFAVYDEFPIVIASSIGTFKVCLYRLLFLTTRCFLVSFLPAFFLFNRSWIEPFVVAWGSKGTRLLTVRDFCIF